GKRSYRTATGACAHAVFSQIFRQLCLFFFLLFSPRVVREEFLVRFPRSSCILIWASNSF
uniref:Uncharacterized protein n=1 Tax=Anopheles arabiensis TaxID=7173 RepID=A0A182IHJ6_ANOAR